MFQVLLFSVSKDTFSQFFFSSFSHTFFLSSFWTRRGRRCRPFFPLVLAFNFYRAQGSAIPLLVDFHRVLLTHALALAEVNLCTRKTPNKFIR